MSKNNLLDQLIASSTTRARKDINQWRAALRSAESVAHPRRTLLYNLYDELMLDAHLSAQTQKRTLALSGTSFSLYNKDGEADIEKTILFKKPWFYQFLNHAIATVFWGHSLLQIGDLKNGEIEALTLVNRRHVAPERGLFFAHQTDQKGINYRNNDGYAPWLVELGQNHDLGLLNKTAPHVLYKRFAQSAWSEFCELFGMPIRFAKTNVKDQQSLDRMENMMVNMSTAAYAVIDDTEDIQFVETHKSDGRVYDSLIDRCNAEVSKLINGAVTGEASQGGSRSKEEVGERAGINIFKADKHYAESCINHQLLPKLMAIGYPLEGMTFGFEKTKDIERLWNITAGLLQYKEVDNEFITNTFGVPVADKPIMGQTANKTLENNKSIEDGFFG